MEIFKIDSTICDYYSDTKEDEEGANIIVGWCHDNGCECSEVPFDECLVKAIQYCKLKDKQLKRKEQECEELKKQNNQLDNGINEQFSKIVELEGRNNLLKVILTEIKEIMKKHCRKCKKHKFYHFQLCCTCKYTDILQKISEVLDVEHN